MWIKRALEAKLLRTAQAFPCLLVTGPRQAGKSSLLRHLFPEIPCLYLDDLPTLRLASEDPKGFLAQAGEPVILDEVQLVGNLFVCLKHLIDEDTSKKGRFLLTGSQVFELMRGVSDSLPGRAAILELLPLSWAEIMGDSASSPPEIRAVWHQMWRGFFPAVQALHQEEVYTWMSSYLMSVVSRDIRSLLAIEHLGRFQRFLELLALRAGQVLNLSEVAKEAQVSHAAARDWISVLEATYMIKFLKPWHTNLSKRAVKSPKLLFVDTGLLCYLLNIRSSEELRRHPLYGNLFENMVAMEMIKRLGSIGRERSLYYYRQDGGAELDLLIETADGCWGYEVKSTATPSLDDRKHLIALQEELRIQKGQVLSLAEAPLGKGIMSHHFLNMELPS